MIKDQISDLAKKLLNTWRAQEQSFRIAVWVGIILIAGILYLHHYLEPLATDTEFVSEENQDEHTTESIETGDYITGSAKNTQESRLHLRDSNSLEFTIVVKNKDTLSKIFNQYDISANDLYAILALKSAKPILTRLKLGQELYVTVDKKHRLQKLTTPIAYDKTLHISKVNDEFVAKIEKQSTETKLMSVNGTITSSLYQSTKDAKVPFKIAQQLAQVFSGRLNFNRDLHAGDSYKIIYQTRIINGTTIGTGDIVAAEVTAHKKTYTAIRYQPANGRAQYFSPNGESLQKAFLRNPVKYARISSKFNPNRMHPILNIKRPHYGVDFAAPAGTPVKAAGDGKIAFAGRKGGYGNTIIINHGNNVTTRYGHLKKFAKNIRPGIRVEKDKVIGYVGSTGLATGPHLHYEYRLNGKALDPLKVKLPESYSLPKTQMAQFKAITNPLLAELQNTSPTRFAQATNIDHTSIETSA